MQVVDESSVRSLRYPAAVSSQGWSSQRITRRRTQLGLSQADLAKAVGASLRAVQAWESGESEPQRRRHERLNDVLGPLLPDVRSMETSALVSLLALVSGELTYRYNTSAGLDSDEPPARGKIEHASHNGAGDFGDFPE